MNTSPPAPARLYPETIAPLTALRFFAAAAVFFYHVYVFFPHGSGVPAQLAAKGYLGVDFFFILSGFILTHVYAARFSTGTVSAKGFLIHRLARIYPVHIITLLIAAALGIGHAKGWALATGWREFFENALLIHAWGSGGPLSFNGPSWSISAEWFAYLCFPLLIKRLIIMPVATAILFSLWFYALCMGFIYLYCNVTIHDVVTSFSMLRIMPEFILGITLYLASTRKPYAGPALMTQSLLAALLLSGLYAGLPDYISIFFLAGIIYAAAGSSLRPSKHCYPALLYLGEISYCFYMIHALVLYGFWRLPHLYAFGPLWIVPALLVTLGLSAALYHGLERPARFALRRWSGT